MVELAYISNSARGESTGRLAWADRLRDQGFRVTFVLPRGEEEHLAKFERRGVRALPYGLSRSSLDPRTEVRSVLELASILRREQFRIVHTFGHKANVLGSAAARIVGVPVICNHVTGLGTLFTDPTPSVSTRLVQLGLAAAYRAQSHAVNAVFFQNPDDAEEFSFLPQGKCIATPGTGIDVDDFDRQLAEAAGRDRMREQLGIPPTAIVAIYVGRLLRDKGVEELLEAAHDLVRTHQDFHLVIVGPIDRGNRTSVAESVVRQATSHPRVHALGLRDDVPALLRSTDIFVNPSHREGLPRTNLEAMAAGLPVITTDAVGCKETVVHKDSGLLVPTRDARALALAIQDLIHSADTRREMGHRSRQLVVEKFSTCQVIEIVVAAYRRALAQLED